MNKRYELTDEQRNKIKSYFEKKKGRPYKNLRATINGIIWVLKTGAMWRDLPSRYGDWNAVYKCFSKWQAQGVFEKILADLSMEADFQDGSIDSTIIKVHQDAGSKKRINRKK